MKKNLIKKMACVMTMGLMVSTLLSGCKSVYFSTGLSDKEVFKINGVATGLDEAMLYLTCEKDLYEQSFGAEIWAHNLDDNSSLVDYVKDKVKNRLAQVSVLNQLAKTKKITLSEKEENKVQKACDAFYEGLNEQEIEYMGITEKSVKKAYTKYALAEKVFQELTKDVNPEISDADALMIQVQSIYIATSSYDAQGNSTPYSAAEKKAAKQKAKELLEMVNEEDAEFEEIASKYSEADEIEYSFGKGDMVEEYEAAAFKLREGQISKLVTTEQGYYIIKCVNDYLIQETQNHKNELIQEAKNEAFNDIYEPYLASVSNEFNEKLWDSITFDKVEGVTTCNFYDMYNEYMGKDN